MKHTSGEWIIIDSVNQSDKPCFDIAAEDSDGFTFVAEVVEKSDAKLIAAAPELLEALKDLFGLVEDGSLVRDTSKDHESGWTLTQLSFVRKLAAAQAAIKKAEGE